MEAQRYYSTINEATQSIFNDTINSCNFLGSIHDYSTSLQDWSNAIPHGTETLMLKHAVEQVEISCLSLLSGIYRQSFASLRLSLEMVFGMIYFSAHKLEFTEWKNGTKDLNWGTIIDADNGVLSRRFSNAFFPEISPLVDEQRTESKALYRELSEFVHGNYATWNPEHPSLSLNEEFVEEYRHKFRRLRFLSQFVLSLRFLKELDQISLNRVELHVIDELRSVPQIRAVFGGPVENN